MYNFQIITAGHFGFLANFTQKGINRVFVGDYFQLWRTTPLMFYVCFQQQEKKRRYIKDEVYQT